MNIDHNTKENILDAAKAEFALHGFSGARLAVIAENAGVNKALIHYYFKNKDLLYESVWKYFFITDDNLENVPIYFDNVSLTIPEKLYLFIYIIVNVNLKLIDTEIIDILLWELAEGGKFLAKFNNENLMPRHKFFNLILEAGQKEGIFDLKYLDMILLGISSTNFVYKIEKIRDSQKQSPLGISFKNEDEKFLNYMIDYVFKMITPPGKTILIPKIKPEIIEYIDKLLDLDSNKISILITRRILEFLCADLT